jgi:hypothetical protein
MKEHQLLSSRSKEKLMVTKLRQFTSRVLQHDSFRRGLATAAASILVAGICEAAWPTRD